MDHSARLWYARLGDTTTRRTTALDHFAPLHDHPVWRELRRQEDRDPDRVNLTDLWRVAGRPRSRSPRCWRTFYDYTADVALEGTKADGPAWANVDAAVIYAMHADNEIMTVVIEAFCAARQQDPIGFLLRAPESLKWLMALTASTQLAEDGDRTAGDQALLEQIVECTERLDPYRQETVVAQAQRALAKAKQVRSGRTIDGEFVQDR
jgi:hypothetical protein